MKANRRLPPLAIPAVAALALLAASCANQRIIPAAVPAPASTARPRPLPPAPPPAPPPPQASDWRQAPITPGNWTWGMEDGRSVARFAEDALVLRCETGGGAITLQRAGHATAPEPLTITTTSAARTFTASPRAGALVVTLPPRDPLLDAMTFSRGRFMVEAPGLTPLYAPSWPEISRVIEDCR
jgi:hypothetical protein